MTNLCGSGQMGDDSKADFRKTAEVCGDGVKNQGLSFGFYKSKKFEGSILGVLMNRSCFPSTQFHNFLFWNFDPKLPVLSSVF